MATVHLGRVVGAGGFQRLVAIKVMHQHIAEDPEFVAMFLDEARLAAGIRHPNVVATLDIEQGADGLLLVMEYVEGASAHVLVKALRQAGKRLPLPVTLRVCMDALNGLHAAHELKSTGGRPLGLVHRDVSPQNILVGVDGVSRITDFGVARAGARISSTRGSQIKGKVPYMSPEQLRAEEIDRRSDVWAAGVVLWELLTSARLFRAPSDGALVAQVMAGVNQGPRAVDPSIPVEIDAVCMRALSLEVSQRFASTANFADALEEAASRARVSIGSPRSVGKFVSTTLAAAGLAPQTDGVAGVGAAVAADYPRPPQASRPSTGPSQPTAPLPAAKFDDDQAATVARDVSGGVHTPLRGLPEHGSGASSVAVAPVAAPRATQAGRAAGVGVLVGGALGMLLLLGIVITVFVRRSPAPPVAAAPPASVAQPAPTPTAPPPITPSELELAPDAAAESSAPIAEEPAPEPEPPPASTATPKPAPANNWAPRPKPRPQPKPGGNEFEPDRL